MASTREGYGSFSLRHSWQQRTRKPGARLSAVREERKEPEIILKHLKQHITANEVVLTERTKFAQMKQEPHESVKAWEGRVKEQGRRLEYCANYEDQLLRDKFISGINNKRPMSKLLDKGHRDKATKEITHLKQCCR